MLTTRETAGYWSHKVLIVDPRDDPAIIIDFETSRHGILFLLTCMGLNTILKMALLGKGNTTRCKRTVRGYALSFHRSGGML